MTTLVHMANASWERRLSAVVGRGATAFDALADTIDDEALTAFPAGDWYSSEEATLSLVDSFNGAQWAGFIARSAARVDGDTDVLERLAVQSYQLGIGRRAARIREALSMAALRKDSVGLVSDLPPPLRDALTAEFDGRIVPRRFWCGIARLITGTSEAIRHLARHGRAFAQLASLRHLPPVQPGAAPYVAWIHAQPPEVASNAPDKMSLVAFLEEARNEITPDDIADAAKMDVVVHGSAPASLPKGFHHRPHIPPLRSRPRLALLAKAMAAQLGMAMGDLLRAADWRHRVLTAPILQQIPAFRLWFKADAPRAVLYSNLMIGGEPPVALLRRSFGVPSMMALYSANYAYHVPPARFARQQSMIEPEIRFITADRIGVWSESMGRAFQQAGYAPETLSMVGPTHFARQNGFRSRSRYVAGQGNGPVRIGVFDVSVQKAPQRFRTGWGETYFSHRYADTFIRDIVEECRTVFGDEFVIVRKLKRALGKQHDADLDFAAFGEFQLDARPPDENLWRLLEEVDLVLCMPFTSVAFMAASCRVPAAYYDPDAIALPSPLGGDAGLLSGRAALSAWLRNPTLRNNGDSLGCAGARILAAACAAGAAA